MLATPSNSGLPPHHSHHPHAHPPRIDATRVETGGRVTSRAEPLTSNTKMTDPEIPNGHPHVPRWRRDPTRRETGGGEENDLDVANEMVCGHGYLRSTRKSARC